MNSHNLEDLIDPLYEIQRYLLASECFIINRTDLSHILAHDSSEMELIRKKVPSWILIINLSGGVILPEEKIRQEEQDLHYCVNAFDINLSTKLSGLENDVPSIIKQSCKGKYWKLKWRNNFRDILFITTLDKVPAFVHLVEETTSELRYPFEDVGCYIQPLVRAGACHVEFSFFYDSLSEKQTPIMKNLYQTLVDEFFQMGAFFSRPYGSYLSNIVYGHKPAYTRVLKEIKEIFDPNNIVNPEKLCFNGGKK
jgi:hypothetical protein